MSATMTATNHHVGNLVHHHVGQGEREKSGAKDEKEGGEGISDLKKCKILMNRLLTYPLLIWEFIGYMSIFTKQKQTSDLLPPAIGKLSIGPKSACRWRSTLMPICRCVIPTRSASLTCSCSPCDTPRAASSCGRRTPSSSSLSAACLPPTRSWMRSCAERTEAMCAAGAWSSAALSPRPPMATGSFPCCQVRSSTGAPKILIRASLVI